MLPYWIVLSVFSLGALLFEGRRDKLGRISPALAVSGFALLLFIGLRYEVGADWEPYRLVFWEMRFLTLERAVVRSDPAYGLLNWIVREAEFKFWVVNLICGAVFVYGLFRFAARQTSPWLLITAAIPYIVIVVAMGYTRQATAMGFIFLALCAIQSRDFRRFVIWMFAAALFHRSAIILLPIIALSYSQNRLITISLAVAGSILGYFFIIAPELDTYIARYSGAEQGAIESEGTLVRIFMNVVPAALLLAFKRRFPVEEHYVTIWRNLSVIAFLSLAAFAYFGTNTAVDRLSIYLTPLQLFVFGNLPYIVGNRKINSRLVTVSVIAYCFAVQAVWLILATNARFWIPYDTFPI